jgi:rubrerythrin
LSREESLLCNTCGFPVSSEEPPHSVASCDTLGGYVEDLFYPRSSRGRTVDK